MNLADSLNSNALSGSCLADASAAVAINFGEARSLVKESVVPYLRTVFMVLAFAIACLIAGSPALPASAQVTEKILWSFGAGSDGIGPGGGLVMDANGNLFGTTVNGGNPNADVSPAGIVFKLTPSGQESLLWSFGIGFDGQIPVAGVILDSSGNLYGTTSNGGLYGPNRGDGTVFKLTPAGQESILWNFGNGTDGRIPAAGLIMDANGIFFGTTALGGIYNGGIAAGTVFELTPAGQETVLWNFGNGADGESPSSTLIMDASGNLYGTTSFGGTFGPPNPPFKGTGTLFKLTPAVAPIAGYTESILWNFGNGSDGQNPNSLIMDATGNFFGTTLAGGVNGAGTVFELTPAGQETVLWNFGNGSDGQGPDGLIMDASGDLYGVTGGGGAGVGCQGCGTVFKLSPPTVQGGNWTETILWNFGALPDGSGPSSSLLMDASGNLYGETGSGGVNLSGTVYEISGAVAPGGQLALKTPRIAFPSTVVGKTSSFQLAIRNTGKGQLTGTVNPPPAPFGVQGSGSFNLAPRTQTTITLTFSPTAPTRAHQLAAITSNSAKQSSVNLDLRGVGVPAPATVALNQASRAEP